MGDPQAIPGGVAVSLIICTRNRPELAAESLSSILAGDRLPAEIIIADQSDAPNDALSSVPAANGCEIRYFHLTSRGLSRSRNEALRRARNPVIVMADDDVYVARDWLRQLVGALAAAPDRTVVTGRVLPATGDGAGFVPTLKGGDHPAVYRRGCRVDPLVTFNMAAPRDALLAVGGFDERLGPGTRFPAGEDNEIAHRLLEAGYEIRYTPDAVVYHRAWRSEKEYARLRWGYGMGQGAFLGKHARLGNRRMLRRFAGSVVRIILRLPSHAWRQPVPGRRLSRPVLFVGDLAFVMGIIVGFATWYTSVDTLEPSSDF